MLLRLNQFKGMAPSIAPAQLGEQMAQSAFNCRLNMGDIRPIKGLDTANQITPSKTGTVLSIYPYANKWLNWITDVNCVRSPLADDAYDRRYWTGDGAPKMTAQTVATSTADYPSVSCALGVPAPAVAPTVTQTGTATDTDPLLVDGRMYLYTYVSAYGEKGPPSPVSGVVDVSPGQSVIVSEMGAPTGSYNITHREIYRTNTGSSTTEFQYVATVPLATTSYTDSVESESLGAVLSTTTYDAPPDDLAGLLALPNGCLAGFSGNLICFSEPYLPHAWPVSYQIPLDETIIAIGSYGNSLLVTTTGAPYVVQATTPGSMAAEKLEMGYACVSKRGFVDIGYSCVYPAINGLMVAGMSNIQLATAGILTQEDWQALNPASIHGYLHDSKYIGFWTNGVSAGFIYDPQTGDFSLHDIPATAGHHNTANGKLFVVSAGKIVQWDAGTTKTATWKSKLFVLPSPVAAPAVAQIQAKGFPVDFKLYANGVLKYTKSVTDSNPFRLPSGYRADSLEVEVSAASIITSVAVASTMAELGQV